MLRVLYSTIINWQKEEKEAIRNFLYQVYTPCFIRKNVFAVVTAVNLAPLRRWRTTRISILLLKLLDIADKAVQNDAFKKEFPSKSLKTKSRTVFSPRSLSRSHVSVRGRCSCETVQNNAVDWLIDVWRHKATMTTSDAQNNTESPLYVILTYDF